MAQRMQSPSSINMYRQCPRKYYYRYIKKLPTKPSIHLVRGTVAHSALEYFFSEPIVEVGDWRTNLQRHILVLLERFWSESEEEFSKLEETPEELEMYKVETKQMLLRWVLEFSERVASRMSKGESFEEAFGALSPQQEAKYVDEELQVMGYIDAIETVDDQVRLIDYKTSKKAEITSEYRLQLGIYALMYLRKHDTVPDKVGIEFLRHGGEYMSVNDELLLDAQFEIEQIHMVTKTSDIAYYPKNVTPLCNWCDFYEVCFAK
ncbi:MAG: RecB family exonuclease [Candidatus Woesearchaeota archaeon]